MVIGLDLDDTINNLEKYILKYAKKYNQENNIDYEIKENEWDFDKSFGWNEEQSIKFLEKYGYNMFKEVSAKENSVDFIKKLKQEGNKIVIITARTKKHLYNIYEITENWLKENKIAYDKLITDGNDKAEKCIQNNVDIFVDDAMYHCNNVYDNAKIPVLLFDSKYNQNENNPNIKRIFNWEQAYKEINKLRRN